MQFSTFIYDIHNALFNLKPIKMAILFIIIITFYYYFLLVTLDF
ncbi:hypothetical protein YPPY54_0783, partial [Yersinia pestis PY-54]